MVNSHAVAIFELAVCGVFLVVLCLRLWPSYRLDSFRQRMFSLRDELFDYAAAGNISFHHPSYRLLRQSMNGFIRYAHHLTLYRACWSYMIWRYGQEDRTFKWSESWFAAIKNVESDAVRDKILDFHNRCMQLVLLRIVNGSPLLIVALILVALGAAIRTNLNNIHESFNRSVSTVGSTVIDTHLLEEEAAKMAA